MLDGPEHRIELANPPYMALIGHRDVFGKTIAEALPDAAAQGYVELLDDVFRSGRSFQAYGARYAMQAAANATPVDRYIDFVFQPIRDGAGAVSGIFVEGVDVTSRVLAERRSAGLARLAERFRVVDDPAEFGFAAAELLGDTLGASRAGYGSMNDDGYTLHVERDWTAPGVASRTGDNDLRPYGGFLDVLRRNEMAVASDVRNAGDAFDPPRMESREVRAVVLAPVVEQGRLVAVIYATDVAPPGLARRRDLARAGGRRPHPQRGRASTRRPGAAPQRGTAARRQRDAGSEGRDAHARAAGGGSTPARIAEDGGHRPAHRRHRARFQQPARDRERQPAGARPAPAQPRPERCRPLRRDGRRRGASRGIAHAAPAGVLASPGRSTRRPST